VMHNCVRFEVLSAVWMKIDMFWDVMLCRLLATDVSEYSSTFTMSN
jgi:hypothetical protein